jgi:hypothetical protein
MFLWSVCSSKLSVFKLTLRIFLSFQSEKLGGTLMEQLAKIEPVLEDLRRRRDERVNEFKAIQSKIVRLQAEISGAIDHGDPAAPVVDDNDLSLKRLGELKEHLNDLQTEKVALKFPFPGCLAAILTLIVFLFRMEGCKKLTSRLTVFMKCAT